VLYPLKDPKIFYMAITLNKKAPHPGTQGRGRAKSFSEQWGGIIPGFGKRIKPREVIFFTSQLSLMLEIGTPLTDSLKAIANQTTNPAFKEVLLTMLKDIEEGRQLSDAMKRHPMVFDGIFTSMLKAGETGGFLKKILDGMVEMQEKRQALRTQLRSALTYPAVLCILAILVVVFILVGILPKFAVFFEGKESILPFTTRYLMIMSSILRGYWWACILVVVGLVFGVKLWKESDQGQALIDRLSISAPLIAKLTNEIYTCQFLRTSGHLMVSQVPLLEALEVTKNTFRNRYYRGFIDQIMEHVEQGGRFSQPFATYPYVIESVKQMVATGEEVGNLSTVMLRLAEFYDTEVDRELKSFAAMIEPVALIILGAVVALIVSSVILPLFRIAGAIQ
jgi:type IV pilus assembly protein PilC